MDYHECVVICGNEGGIFKKYNLKHHPRYSMICNGGQENRYDLVAKHSLKRLKKAGAIRRSNAIVLKDTLFDSSEEEYLHSVLCQISNIKVYPHQHLRDVFRTDDTRYSTKLTSLHCDFVIRGDKDKVLFAIDVISNQRPAASEEIANNSIKNSLFAMNNIPLLRFPASEIQDSIGSVISEILLTASKADGKEHHMPHEPDPYDSWHRSKLAEAERERRERIQKLAEARRKRHLRVPHEEDSTSQNEANTEP